MAGAPIEVRFVGTAGQSFGAWNPDGLHLYLEGDANDYVGKGMAGGRIVLYPPKPSRFASREAVIMGNTCLYGATGGRLFAAGIAGERFAVRNSGAAAVVEGLGDHGCEYMTGGVVAVVGGVGLNFGAGMTCEFAFVLDPDGRFVDHGNHELVDRHRVDTEPMDTHAAFLRGLIAEHTDVTGSAWGRQRLQDFEDYLGRFWLVKPKAASLESLNPRAGAASETARQLRKTQYQLDFLSESSHEHNREEEQDGSFIPFEMSRRRWMSVGWRLEAESSHSHPPLLLPRHRNLRQGTRLRDRFGMCSPLSRDRPRPSSQDRVSAQAGRCLDWWSPQHREGKARRTARYPAGWP